MRKSTQEKYKEWFIIWNRQKNQGKTMKQVADFLKVPLTTFFRGIKSFNDSVISED
jgi:chemotaxis methyl-accepting protein methylase